MESDLRLVDAVCELVDARIPFSSRNPDIDKIIKNKPRLLVMNRIDQADPEATALWIEHFEGLSMRVMETDSNSGKGTSSFGTQIRSLLSEKLERRRQLGQEGRPIRVMVVGVPNVGKSAFINRVTGRKAAKAEDRPGVTRGKQWASVDRGLELMDTPGILWPRFEDPEVGLKLAWTGAIRDRADNIEELACELLAFLSRNYPQGVLQRFSVSLKDGEENWELLQRAAINRGFLSRGGEADISRASAVILDEFRAGKLGRISLELPLTKAESNG